MVFNNTCASVGMVFNNVCAAVGIDRGKGWFLNNILFIVLKRIGHFECRALKRTASAVVEIGRIKMAAAF